MEQTIALIKSCIVSKKGGIGLEDLNGEFEKIVGESIPYARLGFSSLRRLLQEVDGLKIAYNDSGKRVLTVTGQKINHIEQLIRKQKASYLRNKKTFFHEKSTRTFYPDIAQDRKKKTVTYYGRSYKKQESHDNCCRIFAKRANNSGSDGSSFEKENYHPTIIDTEDYEQPNVVYEPRVKGQQLIGDDFFLQLVIRNVSQRIYRAESLALYCGLCISGQTIRDCIENLRNIECISNKVTIMLGSVDIYNGASCNDMIADMEELLTLLEERFSFSKSAITLCTIPPLANLSSYSHNRKFVTLYAFNNWIRFLGHHDTRGNYECEGHNDVYRVLDFFEKFTNENYIINYDLFQIDARMISGCRHPYVLWNKEGRKHAMKILYREL